MLKRILHELKAHSPFTMFGAVTGIVVMAVCRHIPHDTAYRIFYVLHPLHVVLSAMVTSSMYETYRRGGLTFKTGLWSMLLVGYVGAIGVATLSDSIIPYLMEMVMGLPNRELHLGFIEEWPAVNAMAILGIAWAYWRPTTRVPHSMHVLVSTWAKLFHVFMAMGAGLSLREYPIVFAMLFVAVWGPCCFSDIAFPLLFVRSDAKPACGCGESACHGAEEVRQG